jgi:general secretion pathway protein M
MARLGALAAGAWLLWALAVQPPLRTLREAPQVLERLDAELQQMRLLAAETSTLRAAPAIAPAQSAAALKAAVARLGDRARVAFQGDRATVTLTGVDGPTLGNLLTEIRGSARARPVEAQLVRGAKGYDGTMILSIGGAP